MIWTAANPKPVPPSRKHKCSGILDCILPVRLGGTVAVYYCSNCGKIYAKALPDDKSGTPPNALQLAALIYREGIK